MTAYRVYRVTFVQGPLGGDTRDLTEPLPERIGDYFRVGFRYLYDPERRGAPEVNRQCLSCHVVYYDEGDPLMPCPRCLSADTTDEITTLYRGGERPGPARKPGRPT